MPTIKNLTEDTAAVVGLPVLAYTRTSILIDKDLIYWMRLYHNKTSYIEVKLPPGSWKIVGWSDELTQEQMELICEKDGDLWFDYVLFRGHLRNYVDNAKHSFVSLLRSQGITGKVLIIKKEKE